MAAVSKLSPIAVDVEQQVMAEAAWAKACAAFLRSRRSTVAMLQSPVDHGGDATGSDGPAASARLGEDESGPRSPLNQGSWADRPPGSRVVATSRVGLQDSVAATPRAVSAISLTEAAGQGKAGEATTASREERDMEA